MKYQEIILTTTQEFFASHNIFDLLTKAGIIYLVLLWIGLIIWVTKDVINRSNNILFQSLIILINTILPILGLFFYLLIRPSKTLLDKYYEELDYKNLSIEKYCPKCHYCINHDFQYCPDCGDNLKNNCEYCHQVSFKEYKICPFCGKSKKRKK